MNASTSADTAAIRKSRGAFFTPAKIVEFLTAWAIRSPDDSVFEPSAGDAEFLVAAVGRLKTLADSPSAPTVHGVEIHAESARIGTRRVSDVGGQAKIVIDDFFAVRPDVQHDAVIGNPPYVRYQDWTGDARTRSREAALRAGVPLSGLASSWAAFTVQSTAFLKKGGRLGLVLPAELLSVNYAAPVRRFLFQHFSSLEIVLFDEQVFPEAEADVVLLLAEGFNEGPTPSATIRQTTNAESLSTLALGEIWTPADPAAKWTGAGSVSQAARDVLATLRADDHFTDLESWGDTTLGIVTGNNKYFTMSPARAKELGLGLRETVKLSPPGSAHLRGLELTSSDLQTLGRRGSSTRLFSPGAQLSEQAEAFVHAGHSAGVDEAYKCRVRSVWYRVPLQPPADLFLTCMNADTPRLTTNRANARHLNSVHGVYLREEHRDLGKDYLPLASLNSVTLLDAEMVGRAYGGGILKIEPREADRWSMPSAGLVADRSRALEAIRPKVAALLANGELLAAVDLVDSALLLDAGVVTADALAVVRQAHLELWHRRSTRGKRGGTDVES